MQRRAAEYEPNELIELGGKSIWRILWAQFASVLIAILLAAVVISALLGDTLALSTRVFWAVELQKWWQRRGRGEGTVGLVLVLPSLLIDHQSHISPAPLIALC